MQIRDRYIEVFNGIAKKCGETASSHVVSKDVSLEKSIGYTRKFVVEHSKEHFRYDYYRHVLGESVKKFHFIHRDKKLVHVDIGCGPGLFSWVVLDYMTAYHDRNETNLHFMLYDHASSMVDLAALFWKRLSVTHLMGSYSDTDDMLKRLRARKLSNYDVLVTFGHVLLQTKDNSQSVDDFARIIQNLFPSNSCTVVAVDAYSGESREKFRNACNNLRDKLRKVGVYSKSRTIGERRSYMYTSLTTER